MITPNAKEIFRGYIKAKGLRHTWQRDTIIDAFLSAAGHLTVDELFQIVTRIHPGIGYATVHRNLNLIRECGLADEIKIGNEKTRFEPTCGRTHHDHLICLKCKCFIEVNNNQIEQLQERLAEANDFLPLRHKLEIYGLCKNCR
ncbi:MAG: transcriptional repressor [Deltaproteobacteria bacterium]|nr:transcriptional repressor [Deltaproteobacteria bacterium]